MTTTTRAAPPPPRSRWWTSTHSTRQDWLILRALCAYRLVLAALLLLLQAGGYTHNFFDHIPWLLRDVCFGYIVGAGLLLSTTLLQRPHLPAQAYLHFAIDLAAITTLVYACHGVGSGIGMLLITPVVACGLILPARAALFTAASGTLAIFAEEILRQYQAAPSSAESTAAGILGLALFVTAMAGNTIARRARRSEAWAVHASTELADLLQLNKHIVETMQTGVLTIETDGRVRLSNAAARRLLGTQAIENQSLAATAPRLANALDAWRAGVPAEDEVGGILPRFMALDSGPRTATRTLILLDDATRLRQRAQQLKLASLGQLTANVAHEIRNPLSAIGHAGELLAESTALHDEDRTLVAVIERQSARINKIVTDILSLSRGTAAAPETIELRTWLPRCAQSYVEMHSTTACPIDVDGVRDDVRVRFDPHHLQRVLHNLWSNSFEHGGNDGRAVQVRVTAGYQAGGQPWLAVLDNGPGIPTATLEHIFEPFFTTARNGTGLGLYIARELCEYNQARLQYENATGHACFRILCAADTLAA